MQNFNFQTEQRMSLLHHHLSTLGGLQKPHIFPVGSMIGDVPTHPVDGKGTPTKISGGGILSAIKNTPAVLFGARPANRS